MIEATNQTVLTEQTGVCYYGMMINLFTWKFLWQVNVPVLLREVYSLLSRAPQPLVGKDRD